MSTPIDPISITCRIFDRGGDIPGAAIRFIYRASADAEPVHLELAIHYAHNLWRIINNTNIPEEDVIAMFMAGAALSLSLTPGGIEEVERKAIIFQIVFGRLARMPYLGPKYEHALQWFSYRAMQEKKTNWETLARLATLELNNSLDTYNPDAWRKQVRRWAQRHGLPEAPRNKRRQK